MRTHHNRKKKLVKLVGGEKINFCAQASIWAFRNYKR